MYKIYEVTPEQYYYGYALVAAHSAAEANEHIAVMKELDPTNRWDSFGWTYVSEDDVVDFIYSDIEGIMRNNIRYSG